MAYVGKITAGGTTAPIAATLYGTCTTAAGTAAKVVTCADFDGNYITGMSIDVLFTYANTASNPTLNINSKGAKSITAMSTMGDRQSCLYHFVYNGSNWICLGSFVDQAKLAIEAGAVYDLDVYATGSNYWQWQNDTDNDGSFQLVDADGVSYTDYLYVYGLALTDGGCITGDYINTAIGNVETLLSQI